MIRPLDHIVLPCGDLAASARAFEALGFQVGRRNRHPWGTENHVIQFATAFLELIALAPDYVPLPTTDEAFPFAGFLDGRGDSPRPSGMLVLRTGDAQADAAAFAADGIGSGRMLRFAREAMSPEGTVRPVAFTLAFAEAPDMPDLGFFVCQQHHPENFWNAAFQQHPNGVTGVAGVTLVATHPAAHADVLASFTGQGGAVGEEGIAFDLAGSTLDVLTPAAWRLRGGHHEDGSAAYLAAIRFVTGDATRTGIVLLPGHPALVFAAA